MKNLFATLAMMVFGLVVTNAQVEIKDVDQVPVFGDCTGIDHPIRCFGHNIGKAVQENISYPEKAKANGISGMVYVSMIIDEEGRFTNLEVARGDDKNLNKAALDCIRKFEQCSSPAMKDGKPVAVRYVVPVKFIL